MARAAKKKPALAMIEFSRSRDIPFNRIHLSNDNVREVDADAGLDELEFDVERREDLILGINVRAVLDADGNETGDFETPAGGRRYRVIARLVAKGRFPEDGLVPCLVKKANAKTSAVDDSLAENTFRVGLHPLDQFRAFKRMVDGGMTHEEVASAYFTTTRYVEQRLVLAKVSPKLHEVYAANGMTLRTLEAFTAHPDHERQEQVWDAVRQSHNKEPWQIREMLTETEVPASDKRARFVGLDAYLAASGSLLPRYLFDDDEEGWLEDVPLLDRLVGEKLKAAADAVAAEGWKWVEADLELPYGYDHGLRGVVGTPAELSKKERREREKLRSQQERLEAKYPADQELPEDIDRRLGEIERQLEAFERRPTVYDPVEIAIAGAFVTVDEDGELVVNRGWVRPEDEPVETVDTEGVEPDAGIDGEDDDDLSPEGPRTVIAVNGRPVEPEEDVDVIRPLPEKLVIELSAHRTIALRNAVGSNPHVAMTALLHKLARDAFRRSTHGATVQVSVHEVFCGNQGTDLKTTPYAKAVDKRHAAWKAKVPTDDDALWDWLVALDDENRMALLAHCMSLGINALYERPNPMSATGISERQLQARMAEADRLARVTGLDMAEAGFRPTVANYFGRVTKQRILEAIAEAVGESTANLLDNQKKDKMWMASEAEERLANTGWLPEPLRLASEEPAIEGAAEEDEPDVALPDFLAGDDEAPEAGTGEDPAVLVAAE
ncbi:chromosome partitioning protein ParB [Rhizobium pusense]|jgi:ParB family chromosome partitioning protein|uniref:ParB/RepB/Spo0J family partition protein n=2 Tax=Pseudomonadota TaxID=1224 RepID=UPI0003088D35|nr:MULTISPECIES: chromosome partitioning protein ParB [Alphaproteobacteria]KAB2756147.1 chromosome partitioning protein ParB [Brucella anthropi]KAB2794750.1 chromosome partitioning protein ParB [Brucella anthropi]KRA68947.1 chromosome partitioning protein ParB [Rhizobium sp. Root651]MDH0117761.1 chromosome partitioning protein ParB [Agrobacterium pusense]MDH0612348.1 chromosome partitioning protein ParB [Agrobacterium sp. GD03872]